MGGLPQRFLPGVVLAAIFPLMISGVGWYYGYVNEIIVFDVGVFAVLLVPFASHLVVFSVLSFFAIAIFILSLLNGVFNISPVELLFLIKHGGVLEYKNSCGLIVASMSVVVLLVVVKHRIYRRFPQSRLSLVIALVAIFSIDQLFVVQKAWGVNILYLGQVQLLKNASNNKVYIKESKSYGMAKAELVKGNRVLLIAMESLGYPKNKSILDVIVAAAEKIKPVRVSVIKEAAIGPTIQGELRILCGLSGVQASSRNKSIELIPSLNCLPKFSKTSIGMHGNVGVFYGRNLIYPSMGFKGTGFKEDLRSLETGCTSAYDAVCDGAVYREINKIADQFVYFMTIDNHHPYKSKVPIYSECRNLEGQYWRQVCSNLIDLMVGVRVERFDTILITGDHPPPQVPSAEEKMVPLIEVKYDAQKVIFGY